MGMIMNGNALAGAAQPSASPPPSAADGSSHPLIDSLESAHQSAKAQFGKIDKAQRSSEMVRKEMDSLVKLGDAVTAEDVVEGLGKMVANGLSPEPLIAMMAGDQAKGQPPMPESGTALAAWLQAHEQQFAQIEGQIAQAHAASQQQLGQAATKVLLAHHIADHVRGQANAGAPAAEAEAPSGPPSPSNPLAG
jgi:hypothetical protein